MLYFNSLVASCVDQAGTLKLSQLYVAARDQRLFETRRLIETRRLLEVLQYRA